MLHAQRQSCTAGSDRAAIAQSQAVKSGTVRIGHMANCVVSLRVAPRRCPEHRQGRGHASAHDRTVHARLVMNATARQKERMREIHSNIGRCRSHNGRHHGEGATPEPCFAGNNSMCGAPRQLAISNSHLPRVVRWQHGF